jgi:hypothetical protein
VSDHVLRVHRLILKSHQPCPASKSPKLYPTVTSTLVCCHWRAPRSGKISNREKQDTRIQYISHLRHTHSLNSLLFFYSFVVLLSKTKSRLTRYTRDTMTAVSDMEDGKTTVPPIPPSEASDGSPPTRRTEADGLENEENNKITANEKGGDQGDDQGGDEEATSKTPSVAALGRPPQSDPAPDGGARAWLVILGVWCISFCSFGWLNSTWGLQSRIPPSFIITFEVFYHVVLEVWLSLAQLTNRLFDERQVSASSRNTTSPPSCTNSLTAPSRGSPRCRCSS